MNQQDLGPRSIVIVGAPDEIGSEVAAGILAAYGLRKCYRLSEVNSITSHGSLYFTHTLTEDEYVNTLGYLCSLQLSVYSWEVAHGRYLTLLAQRQQLQTSLGCEGDGLTPPTNFPRHVLEGQKNLKQLSDAFMQGHTLRSVVTLRTNAQRALMALDNIADCPCDLVYFDTPHAWISWAKKRAQDQAAELRAALAADIGEIGGNKS